jgi:hypothetical protein
MINYVRKADNTIDGLQLNGRFIPFIIERPEDYKPVDSFTLDELKVAMAHPWLKDDSTLQLVCIKDTVKGSDIFTLLIGRTLHEPYQSTLSASIHGWVLGWKAAKRLVVKAIAV